MIRSIIAAFPKLNTTCLDEDRRPLFYLIDPGNEEPCLIIKENRSQEELENYVKVNNPGETLIHFIAVDKCLAKGMGRKSCEAVLLNTAKVVFLELKLNVITTKQKNADDTREFALYSQIGETIKLFQEELSKINESFHTVEVIAQVALPPTAPKSNATYNLIRSAFGEKYGYDYIDSNVVDFS
jgi:hypothetical protein